MKHKKLIIICFLFVLSVGGFFGYKYAYIYAGRKEHNKVISILRIIGTEIQNSDLGTTTEQSCTKNQDLYATGSTVCISELIYNGKIGSQLDVFDRMKNSASDHGFTIESSPNDTFNIEQNPSGIKLLRTNITSMQCQFKADSDGETQTYSLRLRCLDTTRFSLF